VTEASEAVRPSRARAGISRYLLVALALMACSEKKQKRAGGAAPVVIVPVPVFDGGAPGATTVDESEPNDSSDVATPLAIGGIARGKIEPEADVDYFRIDVAEAGALTVTTNLADADLSVDIEDAGGTVIAKSERGGVRVREGVPNLGVQAGRYTAIVRKKPAAPKKAAKGKKAAPPPSPPAGAAVSYEISATLAPVAPNTEREPDDDRGTAIDLIVGDGVSGFVGWAGDVDFWKLSVETLSSKNTIDIEVGAVEGVQLTLELADGVGAPLLVRKGPRSSPLLVKAVLPVVPSGAPPFHYITVKGDKSNPETPYSLRVRANPVETDHEVEPNDTLEKAMLFPSDRKSVPGHWSAGDVDCYAIGADVNPRMIEVELDPSEVDLELELYVDGKVVAKSETKGKGTKEKLGGPVPANAKAVVRVRAASEAAGEGTYELTVREGAPPP
jgi:hypothetical protein